MIKHVMLKAKKRHADALRGVNVVLHLVKDHEMTEEQAGVVSLQGQMKYHKIRHNP